MMKKYKKLSQENRSKLEERISRLLLAGLDYCANVKQDQSYWFSPNNPYCAEAFGIIQGLEVLGYGYFGADNISEEYNLKSWFRSLQEEVKKLGIELGPKEAYQKYCWK